MPLLRIPEPPPDEKTSFKQRIVKKYEAFAAEQQAGKSNTLQDRGERYEIAVALHLYRNHLLNRSEYLTRKPLADDTATQKITMGLDDEYDYLLSSNHGLLLGDAKSDSSGLGGDIKKAISYCLLDRHVRKRENHLGGFSFATPAHPDVLARSVLRNSWEILTAITDCAGITGMNSQLIPTDIKVYFRSRYLMGNQIIRTDALPHGLEYYRRELEQQAGFTFELYRVTAMDQAEIERQMSLLAAKARWANA